MQGYISSNKVDILCLSQTFLNSIFHVMTTTCNHQDLTWQELITLLTQKEGDCEFTIEISYFKTNQYSVSKWIYSFCDKIWDKIGNFISFCRSPNQYKYDFVNFCDKFKLTLDAISVTNSFVIAAIGGFNAKSNNHYTGYTATLEVSKTEAITSQLRLKQIINERTHILLKSTSCINLIFTSGPNLVLDLGISSCLSPKLSSSDSTCKI